MPSNCERCGSPLIQIEHCGARVTGCIACNRWQGDKTAFVCGRARVGGLASTGKVSKLR